MTQCIHKGLRNGLRRAGAPALNRPEFRSPAGESEAADPLPSRGKGALRAGQRQQVHQRPYDLVGALSGNVR